VHVAKRGGFGPQLRRFGAKITRRAVQKRVFVGE
jgi:hypothetical protein